MIKCKYQIYVYSILEKAVCKMRHIFIINPAAGKGRALEAIPYIKEYFAGKQESYEMKLTERPGHATDLAHKFATEGECRIYSVGGDGTVNEIVNGIAGTNAILGVIPAGSGNDFIRSIYEAGNISDIKDILIKTIEGVVRRIDLGRINDKLFINISSIGFDAEVVYNAIKFKKIPLVSGSMAYILGIIYSVIRKKILRVNVEMDGKNYEKKLLLAAVGNGRFYGGGILAVPSAELDDGMFDVCLVSKVGRIKILRFFPKYIKGRHGDMKEVSFAKAGNINITCNQEMCVNIDGEIITSKKVNFEVLKSSIRVVSPAKKVSEEYEEEQKVEVM
jgi:YegS/Rv2252/BmrU family lipid kinase